MKNPSTKYLLLLGATMLAFVAVEYFRPKPIDWKPTYSNRDAIPYGTRALYELLPSLFGAEAVRTVRLPAYNHLTESPLPARSSYVFVDQQVNFDEPDLDELLAYVAQGNQVFLSAQEFPEQLEDTLGVFARMGVDLLNQDSTSLNFTNPRLKSSRSYAYRRNWAAAYLEIDSLPKPALARASTLGVNSRGQVNFIRIPFGKGAFFLHTVPVAFSNFYVLQKPTDAYAFKVLSYLPAGPIFWDEYGKQGRVGSQSLFRFLLNHPSLRWAYYLILATLALYLFVQSRRRQRPIPVVEPSRNTSLEFVETVGQLYFQQRNHQDLALKKITHWLAFVRQHYQLAFSEFDEEARQRLAGKSSVPRADVDALLDRVEAIRTGGQLSEADLLDLARRIDAFYQPHHA